MCVRYFVTDIALVSTMESTKKPLEFFQIQETSNSFSLSLS